ncbi:amidohydrolase [Bacillaceae bacterium Marseille-Q3522]|nr:amidohydrolase [Bacillaceae bacterium Marseille-Q3522]
MKEEIISWRRDFHQHPELGFEEERTAQIVANHLKSLGLEVQTGVGKTGVTGLLRGKQDGPTIALRADMDALPIQDQKTTEYCSKVTGKSHACGHDAHTSILMGTAKLLSKTVLIEKGNIKFIFQPAEEGIGGAKSMIEARVLGKPKGDAIAGLHVNNGTPTGNISLVRGAGCAAADTIRIKIIGKAGHAAYPHRTIDPISISGEIISALQQIASRQVDPLDSVVVTIGKIEGGTATNIIAPDVTMIGTVRTLNPALREEMPERIEKLVKGITEGFGASYKFHYRMGAPSILNDDALVDLMQETADNVLGENHYKLVQPSMGGEDFSYYTHLVPGVFFRLGTGNKEKGIVHGGHHPLFDIDEEALPIGAALLSAFAIQFTRTSVNSFQQAQL